MILFDQTNIATNENKFMRISTRTDRYSDIIKEHLAKDVNDPYTILLALFQEFMSKAQTKSFLYFKTHKHAAFCRKLKKIGTANTQV
jgi:hypothetical protein